MNRSLGIVSLLVFSLALPHALFSQISGIVNQYSEVLSIDYSVSSVEVLNPTSFATSDRVLLIQMKGATIDETNTASFGDIINANGAGHYEMATVCGVVGNDILFSYGINNTYNTSNARLQLVKVYSGTDETVNATLSAAPWNGTTGGVVAIELSGTLTLNADIDVSEQGFRGAEKYQTSYSCGSLAVSSAYFYPFNAGLGRAGRKGEGIADFISNKEYGKGHQGNGGGGGNDHNAGGGGGGNYNAGGIGGTRNVAGIFSCKGNHPGLGGEALSSYAYSFANNRVMMGGGGGAGEDNNNQAINAGDGGGIVLIIADQIEGNGNYIRSNGGSVALGGSDGGSGGGAGGTILLSTNGYGVSALNLETIGGTGGSNSIGCEGPGGGGAGGVIWVATGLPGLVTTNVGGGLPGIATAPGCGSSSNGATAGGAGVVLNPLTIPEDIVNLSACVLNSTPELFGATINQHQAKLFWNTFPVTQFESISIERKSKLGNLGFLKELDLNQLEWLDINPQNGENIYRLKFVHKDGSETYSNQVALFIGTPSSGLKLSLGPNPILNSQDLSLNYHLNRPGKVHISILDLSGREIWANQKIGVHGQNYLNLSIDFLPIGTYFIKVDFQGNSEIQKIFVRD